MLILILSAFPNQLLIDLRFAIFSKFVDREQFIIKKKIQLESIQEIPLDTFYSPYKLKSINQNFEDTIVALCSFFKPYNTYKGCGKYSHNLKLNIKSTLEGNGCCSDFTQVFTALCLVNKINVCEISNKQHTFSELYFPSINKSIWIDPEYKLVARDSNNNYLSTLDILNYFRLNKKIKLFKIENKKFIEIKNNIYFNNENFTFLSLTISKNIFHEDEFNIKYNFLPRTIRQSLYLMFNNYPGYYILNEKNIYTTYLKNFKFIFFFIAILILFFNLILIKYRKV